MQGATVNINNHQCEIIGRVCMDQTIVKVPDEVQEGDKVVLLDNQFDTPQSVEALADKQNTISYEVLCNFGRRVPRIYYINNQKYVTNELLK